MSGSKQNLALMLVEERCATVEDPLGMLWCAAGVEMEHSSDM